VGRYFTFYSLLDDKMKKLALILMFTSGAVAAQTVTYTNQYGMPVGTAQTNGSLTTYSNQYGQVTGYAQAPQPTLGMTLLAVPTPQPLPVAPIMPVMPILMGR
jgi:hypothetical protein